MKQLLRFSTVLLLTSCHAIPESNHHSGFHDIGWMHGKCLAIKNSKLKLPVEVTVVHLENNNQITQGHVINKATSADNCYALTEDRKQININNGYSFYQVSSESDIGLAIGLIHIPEPKKYSYHYCTTSEGIQYSMKLQGNSVWQGYYYIGYDSEETCSDEVNL
ncbi:hypothetical protein [Vibrio rhizosphaerae]|uniref:Lipoprotein n=1 Tax=Vibrio rhizosphaerae TaxID=398736 RepID=A0ABU4IPR5_9VIBR|nr:hypothetical protein [Vibrio rhizosphaerae]MDW6091402.1 hypothetical protein [Vibrio rhizosphaerae]